MGRRLDDACRKYVKLRDEYTCQLCGITQDQLPENNPYMHWSHLCSRRYYSVRWDQRNSICSCERCHREFGAGLVVRQVAAIDRMWGSGTAELLENTVRQYPTIKSTYLNTVDFRLSLEKYFLQLTHALEAGTVTPSECRDAVWTDWGMPITTNTKETHGFRIHKTVNLP